MRDFIKGLVGDLRNDLHKEYKYKLMQLIDRLLNILKP